MPESSTKPEAAAPDASPVAQFEQSLDELEQLVAKMEGGELTLDESLRSFERGIVLYRRCQAALEQTEARVKLLLDPGQPESARAFAPPEEP
ncbi:MAG TPA: exodeoxyribonuclease VII small subunit [Rhodanobacteraceae bacterium]|jgi:exodeoxyribonuclease VII small subunit